jgi:hypothetical protein
MAFSPLLDNFHSLMRRCGRAVGVLAVPDQQLAFLRIAPL